MKPEKKISKKTAAEKAEKTRAKPKQTKTFPKKEKLEIPRSPLEGDQPSAPVPRGPGQPYALGPARPTAHFADPGDLPESYGTKKLIVTARDPHWLYAHWDLTREQLNHYNALSA